MKPAQMKTGKSGKKGIQLYISVISITYNIMFIVLIINALIFLKKSTHSVKYGFYLTYK